ncbi:hypothetical protein BGZ76_005948, partial [Entomortierella beljakovae]
MTTQKIKLFCILDGDSSAFEVKFDADDSIATLKKAIKHEDMPELKGIHSRELILFHISIPSSPKRLITFNYLSAEE